MKMYHIYRHFMSSQHHTEESKTEFLVSIDVDDAEKI
jgi:hypothetical protein